MDLEDRTGSEKYFGSLNWFVVQTKPREEARVNYHLQGMEIEALLPLCEDYHYSRGRMCRTTPPLFPSYLFARLDLGLHYYKVKWTRGVNRVLGIGNGPTPVSEAIVQAIRERMAEGNVVKLVEDLREGDLVQITSGPLKDFVGVFQKGLPSSGRVSILLKQVGAEIPARIPRWQIRKVA